MYASPAATPDADYYIEADHHLHQNSVPEGLAAIHRQFQAFIEAHASTLQPCHAILDIGASMGHFLNIFKEKGYSNLIGIEASRNAHRMAMERYNIEVASCTLETFETSRRFQLITLCGVLEHLIGLRDKVARIASLLAPDGLLFVAVPDASRFASNRQGEPFLEFASEHINFFTPASLDRLLAQQGLQKVAQDSIANCFYGNHQLVGLYCLANRNLRQAPENDDTPSVANMKAYIAHGLQRLSIVNQTLDPLVASGEAVVIWGTGQLTARLLASSNMSRLKIEAFVDNNSAMHGRTYHDRPVHPPRFLAGSNATLLIASLVHAEAIQAEASRIPGFSGKILSLPACSPAMQ